MKILIVTNHSYMFWHFRKELTRELLKRGEVVISTPFVGHEDDLRAIGCRLIETQIDRRGISIRKDIALFFTYYRMIRAEKPDFVLTYSIKPNIYAGFACRLLGVPYAVNVQGLGTAFQQKSLAGIVTRMYRTALKKARRVFFENEGNAAVFQNRHILTREQMCILSGAGVNLETFPEQPFPSEENGIRFLYLGRIMHEKGISEVLAAASKIKKQYGEKVQFDLVGFFEDDYQNDVDTLVRQHVLCFHGFQQDPRPFYAQAHCVLLPSYHEGMSNVLLEAAATGRALITSDIPGCREAVTVGKNGFLIPPRSVDALYEAIIAYLELTPEKRREMGRLSRRKMELEFDKTQVVRQTLDALNL